MSKISFESKEKIKIDKSKLSDNINKIIELTNEEVISIDEGDNSGLNIKSKYSTESPETSCSENFKSFSQSLLSEQLNIPEDNDNLNINKNIPNELKYFLCNENYYKKYFLKELIIKKNPKILFLKINLIIMISK